MKTIRNAGQAMQARDILTGLSAGELRSLAQKDETLTEFGSPNYNSKIKSRSAGRWFGRSGRPPICRARIISAR